MPIQSTLIDDLNSIKKLYNSSEKPFSTELITDNQRKNWKKIKQSDFCKPSESELTKSGKDFTPLILKKSHGHNIKYDDYVFSCSYRTSQDFWRYEDTQSKKFACQYPHIEEIIRLAVFVKMEPCRCIILIIKLCFEKYWKKNYPLNNSFDFVFEKFVTDFELNSESILHSGIFRDQKTNENLTTLYELYSVYYPGTNFYYNLSAVLSKGKKLISCRIDDLSINAFLEKQIEINEPKAFNKKTNDEQNILIEVFESVFDILKKLSQHIVETEDPHKLTPLIEDIERAKDKLKVFYINSIQNKQKGLHSAEDLLQTDKITISREAMLSSGLIDPKIIRLINIAEKYDHLGKILLNDPYLVLE